MMDFQIATLNSFRVPIQARLVMEFHLTVFYVGIEKSRVCYEKSFTRHRITVIRSSNSHLQQKQYYGHCHETAVLAALINYKSLCKAVPSISCVLYSSETDCSRCEHGTITITSNISEVIKSGFIKLTLKWSALIIQ